MCPRLRLAWEPRVSAWRSKPSWAVQLCDELELVYVRRSFRRRNSLTAAHPTYDCTAWTGARHVYTDDELRRPRGHDAAGRVRDVNNIPA